MCNESIWNNGFTFWNGWQKNVELFPDSSNFLRCTCRNTEERFASPFPNMKNSNSSHWLLHHRNLLIPLSCARYILFGQCSDTDGIIYIFFCCSRWLFSSFCRFTASLLVAGKQRGPGAECPGRAARSGGFLLQFLQPETPQCVQRRPPAVARSTRWTQMLLGGALIGGNQKPRNSLSVDACVTQCHCMSWMSLWGNK